MLRESIDCSLFYIALTMCQQFQSYQIIYYFEKNPMTNSEINLLLVSYSGEISTFSHNRESCSQFRPGLVLWLCKKYKHLREGNQSEILTWFQIKNKSPCTVKILRFLYCEGSSCREKIRVPSKQVTFG